MLKVTRVLIVFMIVFCAMVAQAQERFSFFQASTPESIARMLKLANLRDNDVVVDLGSGDGAIVLTAAEMNSKLRGWGVDIDEKLVIQSNETAKERGFADRVKFFHQNAFDADLRDATVITMWLFPELMHLLRPVILERARPGTRVLASTWDLGSWPHDEIAKGSPAIYKWIVPARVEGYWSWELPIGGQRLTYSAVKKQHFQSAEGVVRVGNRRGMLSDMKLRGEDLSFTLEMTLEGLGLTRHEFTGKVRGERIEGTTRVSFGNNNQKKLELPWRASRTATSHYFAHTGTDIR